MSDTTDFLPSARPPADHETPAGWEDILDPGERIVWQGRPDGAVIWRDLIHFQTFFGLFFTGFACFWITMAAAMGGGAGGGFGLIFPLFGLPFVAVGLYMVIGRIFFDAWQRRNVWYTLTSKAAYVATQRMGSRKLDRYALEDMELELIDDDPGTVWFGEKVTHHPGGYSGTGSNRRYRGPRTTRTKIGFRRIEGARGIYRQLREARAARRGALEQGGGDD